MSMPKQGRKAVWQLASPDDPYGVAAPASDTARLEWLGTHLAGSKWADTLDSLRPVDKDGEYTEKYIGGPGSLRAAIDAAMRRPAPQAE